MKIGLALGGGGVMGVAHLALLEELEKNKIQIDAIAGTSAGAIIGGLYASGGTERVHRFMDQIKEKKLLTHSGILSAGKPENVFYRLEEILTNVISLDSFSQLKTEFRAVAVDIDLGKQIVLEDGSLIRAIMASSAYPGVFPAQEIEGKRLMDGGIINNLPSDVLRDMDCDFVIASSLQQIPVISRAQKYNRASIAARALDIMQLELEKIHLSGADFCFLPPVEEYRWYHYNKIDQIYQKSQIYAKNTMPDLKIVLLEKSPKGFFEKLFFSN